MGCPMTGAETLTSRMGGRWRGSYGEARCPVHDDHSPSLTIRNGDRAPLVKCHRGCDPQQIVTALRQTGYWPEVVQVEPPPEAARQTGDSARERRGDISCRSGGTL